MRNHIHAVLLVAFLFSAAWQVACGGSGGGVIVPTPKDPTVTISASPSTITKGQSSTVSWNSTNADSCSASGDWSGSLATSGSKTLTPSATGTYTYTATCTGKGGSATASAKVTVNQRVISIALDMPLLPNNEIPHNEIYSDFGVFLMMHVACTGCQTGDTLTTTIPGMNATSTDPYVGVPWVEGLNFVGPLYVPRLFKIWVAGFDGALSNVLWYAFTGSQNVAVQDPSSGEFYYYDSGNGTSGSGAIRKFKPDGTADGGYSPIESWSGTISLDNQIGYVIWTSGIGGVVQFDANLNRSGGASTLDGVSPPALVVDARDGLACLALPQTDTVYCYNAQEAITNWDVLYAIPGIPSGSQPTAVKVFDASHVAIYGRGDQTLRWYTVSGTTHATMSATATGTLQLPEFTEVDASLNTGYWQSYPVTGGWYLAAVGGTIGVMGQVVNNDGTVSQKLALVNNIAKTLSRYVNLPGGTIRIAEDPANNAFAAEYPDFSGDSPVTRFARIYADTGNVVSLTSTSDLVPGAGFLVTNDGSHIAVFVGGEIDLQPNQ